MHARPTHRIKSKGWDGSVRGKIAKGHFVQGMQHPRIFDRGHIGRGWTNIAPFLRFGLHLHVFKSFLYPCASFLYASLHMYFIFVYLSSRTISTAFLRFNTRDIFLRVILTNTRKMYKCTSTPNSTFYLLKVIQL